ncbi:MAG: gamma carbonic anhydrase family protein [Pseudomonadota bacterium]
MNTRPFISNYGDKKPTIHPEALVDVSARIIGDVLLEEFTTVWPMAVLRADSAAIKIGRRTAVLDLAMVEAPGGFPVEIGEEALISHGAMVHGAKIKDRVLVGIGAIVLDGAVVESGSIIGAGSLVTRQTHIPANSLVLGSPGRVVRQTTAGERDDLIKQIQGLIDKSRIVMRG